MAAIDKPLLTSTGTFYNVDVFIQYYKLDRLKVFAILSRSKEQYMLDNLFVFKNSYYITIVGFMFIVYMYRIPADNPKSKKLFTNLLDNVSNVKTFSYKLLGTYIQSGDLPYHSGRVLVMDDKEFAGYICLFKIETSIKLTVSYSIKVRLDHEIKISNGESILVEVYHMASLSIAKQTMTSINLMFGKLRDKNGMFNANGNILSMINKRLQGYTIM